MIIAILAWSGALLSCLLSLPQLLHALRSDRLDGISSATYWLMLGNATIWAAWAILANEYAAGIPSLVNGPAAVLIIARLRRTRRPSRLPSPAEVLRSLETEPSVTVLLQRPNSEGAEG
ncbi:MAG TPA: PQ-loop domain-containing transporter [Microlunatus sp.]